MMSQDAATRESDRLYGKGANHIFLTFVLITDILFDWVEHFVGSIKRP